MEQLTSVTLSPVVGKDACVLSYSLLKNQCRHSADRRQIKLLDAVLHHPVSDA